MSNDLYPRKALELAVQYATSRTGDPYSMVALSNAFVAGYKAGQSASAEVAESLARRVVAQAECLSRQAEIKE